jgi:serine/threonine protein kinase
MRATNDKLDEKYIIPIARELAVGLHAIHEAGIIHRDVKGTILFAIAQAAERLLMRIHSCKYSHSRRRSTGNLRLWCSRCSPVTTR